MSNSALVDYIKISPNRTSPRNHIIDRITIHHMAGNLSVETCGNVFAPSSRKASSNYGIDSDGRVGMYVEEKDRSWCSSNSANDHRAVTIEVADDVIGNGWHSSEKAMNKLIDLCVDICQRNGIARLNYTGDASGNLTMHKWFSSTDCPGAYLESKFPWIAERVNKRLSGESEEKEQKEERRKAEMQCFYKIDGGDDVYYFDGQNIHILQHPDERTVLNDIYKANNGRDMPFFDWKSVAPWYKRLQAAINRGPTVE